MAKRDTAADSVTKRLQQAADDERRLLRRERRAEQELAELQVALARDRDRLRRAQDRVERRLAEVAEAETRLRKRQAARAAGPAGSTPGVAAYEPAVAEDRPAIGAGGSQPPSDLSSPVDEVRPTATPAAEPGAPGEEIERRAGR